MRFSHLTPLLVHLATLGTVAQTAMAQALSTSRIENTSAYPLVIANRSTNALPLRIISGASNMSALEISANGSTWLRGPVSLGIGIGAATHELMRIGSIAPISGRGITISLDATSTSTGLLIRDVGPSGSNDAGLVLLSQSNGTGTGIRIGGPNGSGRPTLGTGLDITGGTGIRYNALSAGNGVALDIGGTTPPRRGIEIIASGPQHAGIIARANTNGIGILGVSQSSIYESVPLAERVGVRGHAATNSGLAADTIIGVMGSVTRGGSGSTQTTSIAMMGRAESIGTNHAGTAVGVNGMATSAAPGVAVAIGGVFTADTGQFALMALGGDVLLGGVGPGLPQLFHASTFRSSITRNRTYVHHLNASGLMRVTGLAISATPNMPLPPAIPTRITIAAASVIRLEGNALGSVISGIQTDVSDRVLTLIVISGQVDLVHEHPAADPPDRIRIKNAATLHLVEDDMIQLWYDQEIQRWRCYSF